VTVCVKLYVYETEIFSLFPILFIVRLTPTSCKPLCLEIKKAYSVVWENTKL